jgi:diguanylate cyclase (GGDEF)-like protein/PAS domain S-box-containing protein
MPLSRNGDLSNLFDALDPVAPELRSLAASFQSNSGSICDSVRVPVSAGLPGKRDPLFLSISLLKLDAERLMAVITDVSLAVKREKQLKQSEIWFNAISTGVTDYALMTLDSSGRVEAWNASIGRVTGFSADEVVGQPFSVFYPAGAITHDRVEDRLLEAELNGWSLDNGWRKKGDGSVFWASAMIAPLRSPGESELVEEDHQKAYGLIIRDISDKREASETIRRATSCDHLTGLANRRAFFEAAELELQRWQRHPRPLSLLMFDADHFKQVNDTFGHAAGDAVLRHFAALMTATFREIDLVARIGGEEFVALLPSTDLAGATRLAEQLCATLRGQVAAFEGLRIPYSVSVGVTAMSPAVLGLDDLMRRADQALYAAKAAGRDRVETG